MCEWDDCEACFKRAKEGFICLLGENSTKATLAAYLLVGGTVDEYIVEYRRLWEMAKVLLPDEAFTFDIANDLGIQLEKGQVEESKVFHLAALKGRRKLLGEEHKKTLDSLNNIGIVLQHMKDYEGALDYYQQAHKVSEKVLGKTHTSTLDAIMNMAIVYEDGLGDRAKDEEM